MVVIDTMRAKFKEGVQFTTSGDTPPAVVENFWIFLLKIPLNASKVPKKLFNSYQNVQKNFEKKWVLKKYSLRAARGVSPRSNFPLLREGYPPPPQ